MEITNPILPGFNPDPSIVRAGDDYYVATSTFEWFPGVQIHHSRDLVNWRLVAHPLDRVSQLDMAGNPNSGGIWAPCLTYADDQFWLIYTDVKLLRGAFKVTHNYLVTAPSVEGPWSEPVYLNSTGFDPSLFHDADGRKWLVNMDWDWRPGHHPFAGILLQEYDHEACKLTGPIRRVFKGTPLKVTEGPHLYHLGEYYYLLTAEGGTGHEHAVSVARSRSIEGPYETDPENPVLTAHGHSDAPVKKAGHADIVETPDGWYMVHLCSRPIGKGLRGNDLGWSVLGRETGIQKVAWTDDGWLRLAGGGNAPALTVPAPALPATGRIAGADAGAHADATSAVHGPQTPVRRAGELVHVVDEFDAATLAIDWQSPRAPLGPDQLSLSARPGYLRLYGEDPPRSHFRQSLLARRQQAFRCFVQTEVDFVPADWNQLAGLICYYNTWNHHYLYITGTAGIGEDTSGQSGPGAPRSGAATGGTSSEAGAVEEAGGRVLGILSSAGMEESFPLAGEEITLPATGPVYLRAAIDYATLQFAWSSDGGTWHDAGPVLDMTVISDEMGPGWGFTGSFLGICAQDLSGLRRPADFARFEYRELGDEEGAL